MTLNDRVFDCVAVEDVKRASRRDEAAGSWDELTYRTIIACLATRTKRRLVAQALQVRERSGGWDAESED